MKYVIDCSVAFKWAVMEIYRPKAVLLRDDFRNGVHELLAPDHFPSEIGNALFDCRTPARKSARAMVLWL